VSGEAATGYAVYEENAKIAQIRTRKILFMLITTELHKLLLK